MYFAIRIRQCSVRELARTNSESERVWIRARVSNAETSRDLIYDREKERERESEIRINLLEATIDILDSKR